MVDATVDHHHGTGAARHVHAMVDHLANDALHKPCVFVEIDEASAAALGLRPDDLALVTTQTGRSLLGRIRRPASVAKESPTIRMDRFARQSIKAHLNDDVKIEPFAERILDKIVLRPGIDVSLAHDLAPHIKAILAECRTPVATGAILDLRFPRSQAGTTYEVAPLKNGPGIVGLATDIQIDLADSHVPDGMFDITFEDVGGLGHQVNAIRELVQLPLRFPETYRHLGIAPPRGIILYGPPGAGKTHLARAVSNEIDARFYYLNGPDIIGTYSGETEANLRRIFSEASHHAPSIVFIDELDALAPKRGETGAHSDTRAVTQLLSLMDGLKRVDSVVVLATTNRIHAVDAAFRRPGRFDRELFIGPPDVRGRREILSIHSREMPLSDAALAHLDRVAGKTHGFLGADLMELCREAGLAAMRRNLVTLSDQRSAFRLEASELEVEPADFDAALMTIYPSALRDSFLSFTDVTWSQIGGLSEQKRQLKEIADIILKHPAILREAGLSSQSGILLFGPPGSGKTMLAKALANESGANFLSVNGPEIFTKWLGESEEAIREIFRLARQVAPTILFFDQLEAIAPIRGKHDGSMTTERVVSQLLTQIDSLEQNSQVLLIAATNRLELVDPSVVRTGRFGHRIPVPPTDAGARKEIVELCLFMPGLGDNPHAASILHAIDARLDGFSGAEVADLCDRAKMTALRRQKFAQLRHPDIDDFEEALGQMRDLGA